MRERYDAVVVGSGPNGLAAAITLARAGRSVCVLEAQPSIGGGTRSAALTLEGFTHDICSAVHPLALSSPFLRSLPLRDHGLEWVHPETPLAHPFDDGTAAVLHRDIRRMESTYGRDGERYASLLGPLAARWNELSEEILQPMLHVPRHPLLLARFGLPALLTAAGLARNRFADEHLRALFGGLAGHAILPLDAPLTASFGLVLAASAHAVGWPFARGGSQAIADAMQSYLKLFGGEICPSRPVRSMSDLPTTRAVLFDVTPSQLLRICGDRLAGRYRRQLMSYRPGNAVFKLDYALSQPVPWASNDCSRAGTVHLGGTLDELVRSEHAVARGRIPQRPYVLAAQQSLFDRSRAPGDKQTFWAYCHVPAGFDGDMTEAMERQIERFAPGFRDVVLQRVATGPGGIAAHNESMPGGDIGAGSQGGRQLFFRPALRLNPYATPVKGVYLCSSATPPGSGVHGMGGHLAAKAVLGRELR